MSAKSNINQNVSYMTLLEDEEELIMNLLTQIEDQINSLQVEQMELQSKMNKKRKKPIKIDKIKPETDETNQQLDFSVPIFIKTIHEEEEEDND